MNGHVGSSNVGYDRTHGGFGYGDRNADGSRILEFTNGLNLVICNKPPPLLLPLLPPPPSPLPPLTTQFFTGRMPFLLPNQSTESIFPSIPSCYLSSHSGQLSLLVVKISTGQQAVAVLFVWESNHRSGSSW